MEGEKRMKKTNSSMQCDWSEMEHNMLVNIFTALHVMDLIINVSRVCRSWYSACSDDRIWKGQTLDLSVVGRYFFIPPRLEAWDDELFSQIYTNILWRASDLSGGKITQLIFHFRVNIRDEHLRIVAQRFRGLQKLVLPRRHGVSLETLHRCLYLWGSTLESLMIPDIFFPDELLLRFIGNDCPNLKELKFMATVVDIVLATSLVKYLPQLKVLSIRGTSCKSIIWKDALEFLMNKMKNLDILNISCCLILVDHGPGISVVRCSEANEIINKTTRRPTQFLSCLDDMCSCRARFYGTRYFNDTTYDQITSLENTWRVDQISSLSY